jgi:hypothetical protein
MRRIRVCIYGGTDLQETPARFISALAYEVLDRMGAVIVTGGFHHSVEKPHATSTDSAALDGARRYSDEHATDLKECYEAWVPEPVLDSRPDVGGVVRMTEALGITVSRVMGKTPLGRRLAMVRGVDLVVTISGRRHTEVVGEQALELGIPFLPIPNANGDSQDLLKPYRAQIAARFAPGALDECLQRVDETIDHQPDLAARAVVTLLQTAKVGRCLVLLPYDSEHETIYRSTIEPTVSERMMPLRLDQIPKSDAIYTSFADAVDDATAVIVDITRLNENVMYEVGFAHGRGLSPLIFTRDPSRLENLPVYFRTLNVRLVTPAAPLAPLIGQYLGEIKAARGMPHKALST